jgi:hypothetical protein
VVGRWVGVQPQAKSLQLALQDEIAYSGGAGLSVGSRQSGGRNSSSSSSGDGGGGGSGAVVCERSGRGTVVVVADAAVGCIVGGAIGKRHCRLGLHCLLQHDLGSLQRVNIDSGDVAVDHTRPQLDRGGGGGGGGGY